MKMQCLNMWDIRPYENNPRRNDNAVEAVAESIRQCSYVQPIIVDEKHVILAGHTRYKALQLLGYEACECIIVEGLTEEQKRKFRYLDNKTGEAATWNVAKLEEELADLDLGDLDFFNLENEEFVVQENNDQVGAIEYNPEEFGDEQFRYECPECGFRF